MHPELCVIQYGRLIYEDPLLVTDYPLSDAERRALSRETFPRVDWRGPVVLSPPLCRFALVLDVHVDGQTFVLESRGRRWSLPAA